MVKKAENKEVMPVKGKKKTTSKTVKSVGEIDETKELVKVKKEVASKVKLFTPDMFFHIFIDGWKKIFCYKGRSSRVELWSFMLVNTVVSVILQLHLNYTVLSPRYQVMANNAGIGAGEIARNITLANYAFYLSIILPLFPILAMLVRRMHDLNRLAWKGYLEQVVMGVIVLSLLIIGIDELAGTKLEYTILAMAVCFVTILYSVLYYGLKFIIVTLFYKGNDKKNEFGEPKFKSDYDDELALKLSIFYILFVATIGMLYWGVWYF